MLMAPPLGVMVGYAIAALCITIAGSWKLAFFIMTCIVLGMGVICLGIPNDLINVDAIEK